MHLEHSDRLFSSFSKRTLFLTILAAAGLLLLLFVPFLAHAQAASSSGWTDSLSEMLSSVVYVFTAGLGGWLAYIGGYFFSVMVQLSVNSTAYALQFLTEGWTYVRDIANMAFIFILVYLAFTVMLRADTTGTMRALAGVIVVALLINFSFLITRVVIDAGNLLAVQFYNAIPSSGTVHGGTSKDLTTSIMDSLGVQSLTNTTQFQAWRGANPSGVGTFASNFLTLSVIYIAVGVAYALLFATFLMVGVKFLLRTVGLWFIIIASPIAFVAGALPNTRKYFIRWAEYLIKFSFYPAIFLFSFFLLTKIMSGLAGENGLAASILNYATNTNETNTLIIIASNIANVGVRLGFAIALMYVALRASDWLVTEGSSMARSAVSYAGRATFGTVGLAGRGTIGTAGGYLAQRNANNQSVLGKTLWGGGKYLRESSFDARGVRGVRQGLNLASRTDLRKADTGIDVGAPGGQGGIHKFVTDRQETMQRKENQRESEGRAQQYKQDRQRLEDIEREFDEKRYNKLKEQANLGGASDPKQLDRLEKLNTERNQLSDRVKNFGKAQLESFSANNIEQIIKHVNENQIKTLKESEKFTASEKENFETIWHNTAKNSPLLKANETVQQLRKINEALKKDNHILSAIGDRIGDARNPRHATINMQGIDEMRDALKNKMEDIQDQIRKAAPGVTMTVERQKLRNLEKAAKKVEVLEENVKNIPANAGGTAGGKSFDTSKVG